MISLTTFQKIYKFGLFKISVLNFDQARFHIIKLPKRIVLDFLYWQVWLEMR